MNGVNVFCFFFIAFSTSRICSQSCLLRHVFDQLTFVVFDMFLAISFPDFSSMCDFFRAWNFSCDWASLVPISGGFDYQIINSQETMQEGKNGGT